MRPAVWLSVLIFALLIAGLALRSGPALSLACGLLVYLGFALYEQPQKAELTIERSLSSNRTNIDQPIEVQVRITNHGPALHELEIRDQLPRGITLIQGNTSAIASLASGETIELQYQIRATRGIYRFEHVLITQRDRLGLLALSQTLSSAQQLFVVPNNNKMQHISIRPRRTQIYTGSIPSRQAGAGVEFFGLRDYQAGDPIRWINARASARQNNTLIINEFEQERVTEVGIILDVRARSYQNSPHGSLLEQSVSASANLASGLLDQGNSVGMLLYGNLLNWTIPGFGRRQRERILRTLAQAEAGDLPAFEELDRIPIRLFPIRTLLILISPLQARDADTIKRLRARGYQIIIISPDPISFELQEYRQPSQAQQLAARAARIERTLLLNSIRQAGVTIVDWNTAQPFQQVISSALQRHAPTP
jgi:uncharacterized protein (DUF58 family)